MQPRNRPTIDPGGAARPRSSSSDADPTGGHDWYTVDIQHETLRAVLDSLAVSINTVADEPDDIGARVEMLRILRRLERLLPEHFEYEEAGGYLADALAAAPRLTRRAQRLRNQHGEFLTKLAELAERTREAGKSPGTWKSLARTVRKFTHELRHHEHQENTLVHDAFMDDLGGG